MAEENNKQSQQNKQVPKTETPKVEEVKPVEEAPKPVVEPVIEEKPAEVSKTVEEPIDTVPKQTPTTTKKESTESINDIIDVKVYGDGFISTINVYAPASERLTRDTVMDVLKEGFKVFKVTETKDEELAIEWTEKGPWLIIKK